MSENIISPRMLSKDFVLEYIGIEYKSQATISRIKRKLIECGFPKPHPITKSYDRIAVDKWLDKTGGLTDENLSETDELLARIERGEI